MLLSRTLLVVFVLVQILQFEVQETEADSKFKELSENRGRMQKVKKHARSEGNKILSRCLLNARKCRGKQNAKTKRPFKKRRNDKRCCDNVNITCVKKAEKRCRKSKTNCLIRQMRRCRRRLLKCNQRKSTNRRPRNCGSSRRKKQSNNIRPRSSQIPLTALIRPTVKKRAKEECIRSEDCADGLCCARHQHVKICKPLIQINQVCTREYRNKKRSPKMYERCPCDEGLLCTSSELEKRHHTCQIKT